jgi:hypothetical protein
MTRCLSDDALVELRYEKPTVEHLAHLHTCGLCADRYRGLVRDLALITAELQSLPPVRAPRRASARWIPLATAAAAAVVVLIGEAALSPPPVRPLVSEASMDPDVVNFLRDVAAVLDDGSAALGGGDPRDTDFSEPVSAVAFAGDAAGTHDE